MGRPWAPPRSHGRPATAVALAGAPPSGHRRLLRETAIAAGPCAPYVPRMGRRFDRRGGRAGGGASQRQLRVGELIRRALSDVLARGEIHDPDLSETSITVGEVRASPDLKVATAHVLPLGGRDADAAIEALRRNRHEIRRQVARQVTLKFSPELRFRIDDTFERLDAARRLFDDERVRRDVEVRDVESDAEDVLEPGDEAPWEDADWAPPEGWPGEDEAGPATDGGWEPGRGTR